MKQLIEYYEREEINRSSPRIQSSVREKRFDLIAAYRRNASSEKSRVEDAIPTSDDLMFPPMTIE